MSLFNFCCPPKAKKSIDYITRWIDAANVTINQLSASVLALQTWKDTIDNDIESLVDEAVANYDWSTVSEFATLQGEIDTLSGNLNAKTDKVIPAAEGNFASLGALGELLDSGYKASSFAAASHEHTRLYLSQASMRPEIVLDANPGQGGYISFNVSTPGGVRDSVTLGHYNIGYLQKLLSGIDDTPTEDSTKLVTSGGVYSALGNKLDVPTVAEPGDIVIFGDDGTLEDSGLGTDDFSRASHTHSSINDTVYQAGTIARASTIEANSEDTPSVKITLSKRKPTPIVTKEVTIDLDNIDNLNRALTIPDSTPTYNSSNYVTSGGVYDYVSLLLRRLEECEKQAEVEYSISAECTYEGAYVLTYNGHNIFYHNYDTLQYVDYLYNLAVVEDTIVIKDNTTGNAIQTVTVVSKVTAPNRLVLSSNILLDGHVGHTIGIAITHNTYSV